MITFAVISCLLLAALGPSSADAAVNLTFESLGICDININADPATSPCFLAPFATKRTMAPNTANYVQYINANSSAFNGLSAYSYAMSVSTAATSGWYFLLMGVCNDLASATSCTNEYYDFYGNGRVNRPSGQKAPYLNSTSTCITACYSFARNGAYSFSEAYASAVAPEWMTSSGGCPTSNTSACGPKTFMVTPAALAAKSKTGFVFFTSSISNNNNSVDVKNVITGANLTVAPPPSPPSPSPKKSSPSPAPVPSPSPATVQCKPQQQKDDCPRQYHCCPDALKPRKGKCFPKQTPCPKY